MPGVAYEDALKKVEDAFANAPRPPNEALLHPQSMDDMDLKPLYAIAHWKDMTEADVIDAYAAPSFLSAAGFRHFLPAYMGHALENPDSPQAYVSSTIWGLDPSLYDEKIAAYARSKYELFDGAQRAAIVAFLEAMRDSTYGDDAEHALTEWRSQS